MMQTLTSASTHGSLHYFPWPHARPATPPTTLVSCKVSPVPPPFDPANGLEFVWNPATVQALDDPKNLAGRLDDVGSALEQVAWLLALEIVPRDASSIAVCSLANGGRRDVVLECFLTPRFLEDVTPPIPPGAVPKPTGNAALARFGTILGHVGAMTWAARRFGWGLISAAERKAAGRIELAVAEINRHVRSLALTGDKPTRTVLRATVRACHAAYRGTPPSRFGFRGIPCHWPPFRWILKGEYQYLLAIERRIG
jgi:hypothetical protein